MESRRFLAKMAVHSLVLLLCGCSDGNPMVPPDAMVPPDTTLDAEEQVVYREILARKYPASFYVIKAETDTDGMPGDSSSLDQLLSSILAACPGLSDETLGNYRTRNASAHPVPANLSLAAPYVLVTDQDLTQIFSAGNGWDVFYGRYPDARGIIQLSRVGFNPGLDQALVYVGHTADLLAGDGYFYVVQKSGSTWEVTCERMTWIS